MFRNSREKYFLIIEAILVLAGMVILMYRVLFGIDFTDQSWYVAEPYFVAEGAVPYVNNWTQAPGFSLPLALVTKLYVSIRGNTEGIFLFSRIEYVVWLFFAGLITMYVVNRKREKRIPFVSLLPFLFVVAHNLYSINYNTIGVVYLLLACAVLFVDFDCQDVTQEFISGLIGGVIIARSVIGTPYVILPCGIIVIFLIYMKSWKKLSGYICGGVLTAVVVLSWCCIQGGGVHNFTAGIEKWLLDSPYFKIDSLSSSTQTITELYYYLRLFVICLAASFIVKRIVARKQFEKCLYILVCACLLVGFIQYLYTYSFKMLVYCGWFEPIILYLFEQDPAKKSRLKFFSMVAILYSSAFLFSSAANIYGFGSREYWLYIPVIMSFIVVFDWDGKHFMSDICLRFGILALSFLMIRAAYVYVYRDAPINTLDAKIESGIWKGLYTTKERAEAVVSLENWVRDMTEEDDYVYFLDWASFAYLMNDGKACAPTTLEATNYSYGVDDPRVMFDYFYLVKQIPDKIIYIDYGRKEMLSIEDASWGFNSFVEDNYRLYDNQEIGLFRVFCYILEDRDNAINMISQ